MDIRTTAAFTLFLLWSSMSNAGLVRYDVEISSPSTPENIAGFLVFDDAAQVPGNIWSELVEWKFDVEGYVFDHSNSSKNPPYGHFEVNSEWKFVSDFSNTPIFLSFPSFLGNELIGGRIPSLSFTSDAMSFAYGIPNNNSFKEIIVFDAEIDYSEPVHQVSTSPTWLLMVIGALFMFIHHPVTSVRSWHKAAAGFAVVFCIDRIFHESITQLEGNKGMLCRYMSVILMLWMSAATAAPTQEEPEVGTSAAIASIVGDSPVRKSLSCEGTAIRSGPDYKPEKEPAEVELVLYSGDDSYAVVLEGLHAEEVVQPVEKDENGYVRMHRAGAKATAITLKERSLELRYYWQIKDVAAVVYSGKCKEI